MDEYLEETGEWTPGVTLIEKEDDVLGKTPNGIGIDNVPLQDLANRTRFLKNAIGTIEED